MKNKVFALAMALGLVVSAVPSLFAHAQVVPTIDPHSYGSPIDLLINDDSTVTIDGALVEQIADTAFYARLYWGQAFIRLLIRTDGTTVLTNKFNTPIGLNQISVGDIISMKGSITSSSNSLDFVAYSMKDWSLQTKTAQFSGTVTGFATSTIGFMLQPTSGSAVIIGDSGSGTTITKGSLTIHPTDISVGDKITSAIGTYDYLSNTLTASTVKVYQDMSLFAPQNFQGTLVSVSTGVSPVTAMVKVGNTTYTVNLTNGASVMNAARAAVSIGRFLPGDTVRFYGSIQESNHSLVIADTIRNLNL